MKVDISVVVPHLNQHSGVERLLESLDAQEAPGIRYEVIIADNGSAAPLSEACLAHPLVTVVYESTPGPGHARNRGVSVATGEILAFIDADCTADSGWIQAISNHFQEPYASAVIGGDVRIAPRGARVTPIEAYESLFGYRFELYIRRDGYAGTGNLAMLRKTFDAVGPFGGIHIAEDRDWGQRATRRGFTPAYVPEMVIYTNARESFSELARKWDRHIAHDFAHAEVKKRKLAWTLRSLALAISPVAEVPRVLASPRISGTKVRALAWLVLVRIRLYRSRRMLKLLFWGNPEDMALGWHKNERP